jgi:hypothetical protein
MTPVSPILSPMNHRERPWFEAWGKNRPNLGAKSPTVAKSLRITRDYAFRQSLLGGTPCCLRPSTGHV